MYSLLPECGEAQLAAMSAAVRIKSRQSFDMLEI
jgi:hypothetical protein